MGQIKIEMADGNVRRKIHMFLLLFKNNKVNIFTIHNFFLLLFFLSSSILEDSDSAARKITAYSIEHDIATSRK